jgi:hypothetical protein
MRTKEASSSCVTAPPNQSISPYACDDQVRRPGELDINFPRSRHETNNEDNSKVLEDDVDCRMKKSVGRQSGVNRAFLDENRNGRAYREWRDVAGKWTRSGTAARATSQFTHEGL